MASLGDCKLSKDLMSVILSNSNIEYDESHSYDIQFRGSGVVIKEFDADGKLLNKLKYSQEYIDTEDYTAEERNLSWWKNRNQLKQIVFRLTISTLIISTLSAIPILLYLKGG